MFRSIRFSFFAIAVSTSVLASPLVARRLQPSGNEIARVRAWRAQHEPQILRELFDLIAIPNVASDQAGIAIPP